MASLDVLTRTDDRHCSVSPGRGSGAHGSQEKNVPRSSGDADEEHGRARQGYGGQRARGHRASFSTRPAYVFFSTRRASRLNCAHAGYPEDLHYPNYPDDLGSAAGDSITPSYSASQALSRTSSNSSFSDDATPYRDLTIPASHKLANGTLPDLPSAPRDRRISTQSFTAPRARSPPAPRPIFLIPTAPGAATEPSFDIPRAPAHVSTRAPNDDSSDEEDARDFLAHATAPVPRSSMYRVQSPVGRLHRQTQSETSSNPDRGAGKTPRRGSFFGGIAALFKKKKSFEEPSASGWETRTDRHVFATTRGTPGGGRREDESDEEDMPKNVVRVVNDPKARLKALSDVGAKPKLEKKRRTPEKAMSDVGVTPSGMPAMRTFPTSTSLGPAAGLQEVAVGKKRKKKVSTATATTSTTTPTTPTTLVLSPNGEHYSSKSQAVDLSRSNTMTTIGTTTTGTIKRKRKKVISAPPLPIPTAADLASSLPSARSNATLYGKLDEPVQPEPHVQIPRKAPKSLAATETRGKKDHALHGNGNWVAVAGAEAKKVAVPRKVPQGPEQEESLMSIVEREANGVAEETSRKYGPKVPTKEDVVIPRPQSSLTAPGLVKRKSVRLAEGPYLAPPSSHSPPSSIRSDPLSAHSTPRPGILVNNGRPLSSATFGNGESAWETRLTTGRGTAGADSSDEDEGYGAARRQFAKGTSKLESWIGGKGKGREV